MANKYQIALKATKGLLLSIVEATNNNSYVMVSEEVSGVLLKKGWGEINTEIKDDDGNVAARATEVGMKECGKAPASNTNVEGADETASSENASAFVIDNVLVVKKRASKGNLKYPFNSLEIGQSFFVPATAKHPTPWKTLTGAITSANNRFAVPVFEEDGVTPKMRTNRAQKEVQVTRLTRRFAITQDTVDGKEGARMGRIELEEKDKE